MSYRALYRKYRPQTFAEVLGQEYTVRTLQNAITEGRVSHAYMFSGPRGVGKTSIARIFAKAINCPNGKDGEPCNKCDICTSIMNGEAMDVIEIDAASNNGVDVIRDLKEKVQFLPSVCKYKVYIIDEVHMFSSNAFNALLKTLEEPPKHVIFILCTTEPDKVLPTIQSRCQRFEFHLIPSNQIESRLKEVSKIEGIDISDEGISLIAEASEGGMRDALSLLDQCESFAADNHITVNDVLQVSGKISNNIMTKMASAIAHGSSLNAISLMNDLIKMGKEVTQIISGLIVFFKDILVIKNVDPNLKKIGYDEDDFKLLKDILTNEDLYGFIDILSDTLNNMKYAENKQLYAELALIKMADKMENGAISPSPAPNKPEITPVKKEIISVKNEKKLVPIIEEDKPVTNPKNEDSLKPSSPSIKNEEPKEEVDEDKEEISSVPEKGTFDITIVEDVLNNASKDFKELLKSKWTSILDKTKNTSLHQAALLLDDATITATSTSCIIFTFPNVGYCNLIMKGENYNQVKEILKNGIGSSFEFIALPAPLWDEVTDEFLRKYRANKNAGNRNYIKLTPVFYEGLKISEKDVNKKSVEDNRFKEITDLFGDDIKVE